MADSGVIYGEETWRPVPGHGNQFVASSLGRIARVVGHKGGNGYQYISFLRSMNPAKAHSSGSKRWPEQSRGCAHHLVCLAFHGQPLGGKTQVNHKDGDRGNNRPDNLEWSNQSENIKHAWDTGRIPRQRLRRIGPDNLKKIHLLSSRGLNHRQIAERLGVHVTTVGYHLRKEVLHG